MNTSRRPPEALHLARDEVNCHRNDLSAVQNGDDLKPRKNGIVAKGTYEKRHISKVAVNSNVLKTIFNTKSRTPLLHHDGLERGFRHVASEFKTLLGVSKCDDKTDTSFNLMIITTDMKVLLLERTQSFHFPKVIRDLKSNRISMNILTSLYISELEKIRQLFFDFLPPHINYGVTEKIIRVFPGGHSMCNEPISKTLIRELQEETSMNINIQDLRFNKSCIFNVLIYDCIIKKYFDNFIFPVKINMSSQDIQLQFKETRHTRNPTFVDIRHCKTLFDAFLQVQNFMIL
jgi:hypothetical protein